MIERVEVSPGAGTVIRFGGVVAWADPSASPALISFLTQSARNLAPSPRGGRQIADHIAGVLAGRDPEPKVGFAVIGPSDHGWASLLHGPVQAWDGGQWLAPAEGRGWMQAIITPRPAITVAAKGSVTPAVQPDSLWDLEAGVVPGAGFVLSPAGAIASAARTGHIDTSRTDTAPSDPAEATVDPAATAVVALPSQETTVLHPEATTVMPNAVVEPETAPRPAVAQTSGPSQPPAHFHKPAQVEPRPPARAAGVTPPGLVDLRSALAVAGPPLPHGGGPDKRIPGAPVVAGIRCPRGHLNRPGLALCVRCLTPIPSDGAEHVSGTRPALGALVVDDGTIYRLDRPYLVGSDPGRSPTVGGGLARPLALPGDGVAPTHAEIGFKDWDVTVVDRSSASGTSVFEPGASGWTRLRPFEPTVLQPGTHVAFGQRIVTFIGPW